MPKMNSSYISVRFTSGMAMKLASQEGCSLAMKRLLDGILTGYNHNLDCAFLVIQNITSGGYQFSALRLTIIGDVIRIEPHPNDRILISAIKNMLSDMITLYNYEVVRSRDMYSVRTMYDYTAIVSSWRALEAVLCVSAALSYETLSNDRLSDKIRPIIHNDKKVHKLI